MENTTQKTETAQEYQLRKDFEQDLNIAQNCVLGITLLIIGMLFGSSIAVPLLIGVLFRNSFDSNKFGAIGEAIMMIIVSFISLPAIGVMAIGYITFAFVFAFVVKSKHAEYFKSKGL
jgi:hypothetical protein